MKKSEEKTIKFVYHLKISIKKKVCVRDMHRMGESYQSSFRDKDMLMKINHGKRRMSGKMHLEMI